MKKQPSRLIRLPGNEEELRMAIEGSDFDAGCEKTEAEKVAFLIFTRMAASEDEIDRSVEIGDITEEEGELLRDKYVKGLIRSIYGDDSL